MGNSYKHNPCRKHLLSRSVFDIPHLYFGDWGLLGHQFRTERALRNTALHFPEFSSWMQILDSVSDTAMKDWDSEIFSHTPHTPREKSPQE